MAMSLAATANAVLRRCLRCDKGYSAKDNSPQACSYHGHMTGETGMFSYAPPHQGVEGEWSDRSGVIVYKWDSSRRRSSGGIASWKRRWTCCGVYEQDAPACRRGWHVSYEDGATKF